MKTAAFLYETLSDHRVRCALCAHRCVISNDGFGVCGVRKNEDGSLFTFTYGDVIAEQIDPVEKKPLHHFYPGGRIFSIATVGCNFRCSFCQNWKISQQSYVKGAHAYGGRHVPPETIVDDARRGRCPMIAYTYTEPTVYAEYVYDTARLACDHGMKNVLVSNGFMTAEALEKLGPFMHAANIDLKSFSEDFYRRYCKAHVEPVKETIRRMYDRGIWVEVTTLVIPGLNDSDDEFRAIARFLAAISPDLPWHVSRFHPQFDMRNIDATPVETLHRAAEIAREEGLRYAYLGNVSEHQDTVCPRCRGVVIRRVGYDVDAGGLKAGACAACGEGIAGEFSG